MKFIKKVELNREDKDARKKISTLNKIFYVQGGRMIQMF